MELSVSYIPPHQPNHIEADMKYLKEIGCTSVLFALQENHFEWLTGALRFGAKIAKDNGLKPRAVIWGYANTSGGGRNSQVMLKYPDMWRCDEKGSPYLECEYGPQACCNHPKTLACYSEYAQQIWSNGFTEMMIDEPHEQKCFCRYCREKLVGQTGHDLITRLNAQEYKKFQENTVIDYVAKSSHLIKAIDENFKVSVAVMPEDKALFEGITAIPEIDVFATDPYWLRPVNKLTFGDAVAMALAARNLAEKNNKKFELYLGCFGIAGGLGLEEKIYHEGKILVGKSSPDILTAWSFRGGVGLRKEPEECDNPKLAWDSVVKLYSELRVHSVKQ